MKNCILTFILGVTVLHGPYTLAETIYKGQDASGKTIYSDKPFENSQEVTLEPIQTYSTPPLSTNAPTSQNVDAQKEAAYQISITNPTADQTFSTSVQAIEVSLTVLPELQTADKIQLLLNDKPVGEPSSSTTVNLGRLDRGSYQLTAQVINAEGKVLATSSKVTFYQQRAKVGQN